MQSRVPKLFAYTFLLFALAGSGCLAYAYFIEPARLVVKHDTILINGLDPAFDGLRIVMLGDIHGGSNDVTEEKLRYIVAKVNEQDADMIVMLGDYVSEVNDTFAKPGTPLKMPVATIAENLKGLNARHGVFAVLGNHDGFHSDEAIDAAFTALGYNVLRNEVAAVEHNGSRLRLLGFKDHLQLNKAWKETSADAKQLLAESGTGQVIALEHSPDIMPIITGELSISPDLKLVLAAHTHGGQVWFPLLGRPIIPSTFGQKFAYGHIRENDVDLYVTSGIGTSVLPIRWMVPPEIVVLAIKAKPPPD